MKKIFYIIIFILITRNAFALDNSCFEYSWNISPVESKTIKVITDDINNYYFQDNRLLNTKILSSYEKKYFSFEINWNTFSNYNHTFDQYENLKQITLHFPKTLQKYTFGYILDTNNYNGHFEISRNWVEWNKIEDDIRDYDLDYLKITFDNKDLKNTTIYELSFFANWNNEILVNSLSKSDIKVFNNYICDNDELRKLITKTKKTEYFPIDLKTKTYNVKIERNPEFNENHIIDYINKDSDNDWIIDTQDNCPNDYNPNQLDSTANGVWDICSDKDNDNIKWNIDNCPTVYNPEQEDENKNWIWDKCEIDTDKDSIFDSIDNCVNISNTEQYDTDWDWIWDSCDNCMEIYNPDQKDIDWDKIWDVCDKKDNRYIESNKNFFIWLLISIVVLFLAWIYTMVRKLKSMKK